MIITVKVRNEFGVILILIGSGAYQNLIEKFFKKQTAWQDTFIFAAFDWSKTLDSHAMGLCKGFFNQRVKCKNVYHLVKFISPFPYQTLYGRTNLLLKTLCNRTTYESNCLLNVLCWKCCEVRGSVPCHRYCKINSFCSSRKSQNH